MAILKSRALLLEEETRRVQQENADACYAIIDGWQAEVPRSKVASYHQMSTEVPPGKVSPMDDAPFKHDFRALPSRNAKTYGRFCKY